MTLLFTDNHMTRGSSGSERNKTLFSMTNELDLTVIINYLLVGVRKGIEISSFSREPKLVHSETTNKVILTVTTSTHG